MKLFKQDKAVLSDSGKPRLPDEMRFLKQWVGKPGSVGAVAPSSKQLARLMASFLDCDSDLPIIELGPGTGPVTAAILERGIDPSRVTAIEYDQEFCELLRKKFPQINVMKGDAYAHAANLKQLNFTRTASVVSSLPLLTRPVKDRTGLITSAIEHMDADGLFIQFSYGPKSPWRPSAESGIEMEKSKWVKLNIPPARVWTYRKV